jgi:long-chain acyl-CoA synthetase
MRGALSIILRWWKGANGNGRGHGPETSAEGAPSDLHAPGWDPTREPPWLAELDREGVPRSLQYPTTTLGRLLDQAAERFGDTPAVVYNQKRWTYRELLACVNRMAGGLSRYGVRQGDRVVLALPNCPEYVISFFALQKLGALVVNAGPLMGLDDLRHLVTLTTPRVVIGLDLQASKLVGAAKESSTVGFVWVTLQSYQTLLGRLGYQYKLWQSRDGAGGSPATHTAIGQLCENAPARPPTVEASPDATAVLQPTSGTTGSLKLVQLSHRSLLANATQVTVWMGVREGQERLLTILPMFHVYGLTTGLISPIFCAATITLMTRFDAAQTLAVLERERPTFFPMVPAICEALNREIERRAPRSVTLPMRCLSGAAPLPIEVAQRFERLTGARVVEGYGLSESSPVTHVNPLTRPRYGSIGLPLPDTLCRVVDLEDGERDVAVGQPGELLVAGPQIMSGYFENAEETRRALFTDASGRPWLRTGDVVQMDADGFFQVLDRKKDMINRSGLKVYPGKVEKVLKTHESVVDAAVIGHADPVHTEEVVAVIAPASTALDHRLLAGELQGLCRDHLAPYEVPSKFEFTDQIPRSVLGKVLKKNLRRPPDPGAAAAEPVKQGVGA